MKTLLVAGLMAAVLTTPAHALGRLADVTLIDRDTGSVLPTHYHRGEYWVAGRPGAHYAIAVRNRQGERLLAVMSVDGVNVISGETASWSQTGYVFDPQQRYDISGWRKSDDEIAAFTFTALPNSYAARTGRPANIGVVGVALFRERMRVMPMAEVAAAAPAADTATGASAERSLAREAPSKLGTGHGRREYSHVDHTDFERLRSSPDEIIRIRYDSRENLVAMGVIRAPRKHPQQSPDAFPDAPLAGYVPDPPGRW